IYFFKVDDDVLVHLSNLYKFLNDENLPENAIIGRFEMSKTKYLRKRSEFIFQQYQNSYEIQPDFIDEPAYLIPGHMVEKVYMTLINFPLFTLEDVILRIKMTQTLNYNLHSNKKFQTRHFLPFSIPCSHEHFITIHSIKASDMIIRWERLRKPYSCNLFDKFMAYLV
ncbi:CLUMA_CG019945, isoform A, partial [Clunio marinus]